MKLTRRELLGVLSVGAGCAATALLDENRDLMAALRAAESPSGKTTIPKGTVVRTVLRDVPPEEISGATLFHEHIASDAVDELVVEEIEAAKKAGISCFVNAKAPLTTTASYGNIENMKTISSRTGVHIVACGGYYFPPSYPPELTNKTEDQIAQDLAEQARRDKLGAFGEIGQNPDDRGLTPDELKIFHAVGKAHLLTNLPIFTHNPYGTGPDVPREMGLQQLDAFESVGVKPERVAIGHVCNLDDPNVEIIKQICKRGAFVGFDRMIDRHAQRPAGPGGPASPVIEDVSDEQLIREIMELIDAGYTDHLLFADDSTAQPLRLSAQITQMVKDRMLLPEDAEQMKALLYKDLGLGRAVTAFVPMLRKAGVKEDTLHKITHDNPLRFLAFQPKDS